MESLVFWTEWGGESKNTSLRVRNLAAVREKSNINKLFKASISNLFGRASCPIDPIAHVQDKY